MMIGTGARVVISLPAGEDLTGYVGAGVHVTSGAVVKAAAEGDSCGVLLTDGTAGEIVTVCMAGECKVKLGEDVNTSQIGIPLKGESDGTFQLWDAINDQACAVALESGASGALIDAIYICPGAMGTVHT